MTEAFIPGTRSARQAVIAGLLAAEPIGSQSELRKRLADEGITVTQAKGLDGKQVYRVDDDGPAQSAPSLLERWGVEVLLSVQQAGNQLVLRTPPGAAQLLALGIDRAKIEGILGSIAGDDTVLVIAENEAAATAFKEDLANLT